MFLLARPHESCSGPGRLALKRGQAEAGDGGGTASSVSGGGPPRSDWEQQSEGSCFVDWAIDSTRPWARDGPRTSAHERKAVWRSKYLTTPG
jgi:hypothetical protein